MLKGQREIQLYLSFLNRRKIPQKCILIINKVKKQIYLFKVNLLAERNAGKCELGCHKHPAMHLT